MRQFNQCVIATAKGKATTAFDDIGTITITNMSNYIAGFYVLIVNTKPTADEASTPRLRITSKSLGLVNFDLPGFNIGGEGMAAHQSGMVKKVFVPLKTKVEGKDLHFAKITFSVSCVVACTEGFDCAIQLVTTDEKPTKKLLDALRYGACLPFEDGDGAIEAAGAGNSATLAAWGTGDADCIVVVGSAKNLIGICYTIGLNAETASVPLCNYADLQAPDIPGFGIQQHIVNCGAPGSLGTVICSIKEKAVGLLPFAFDNLPGAEVKIYISDINSLTGLTAGDGQLNIVWDKGNAE